MTIKTNLFDLDPSWLKPLERLCLPAFTYIKGFEQSLENYRNWIGIQNNELDELHVENNRLKLELEQTKCFLIHAVAHVYEVSSETQSDKPF